MPKIVPRLCLGFPLIGIMYRQILTNPKYIGANIYILLEELADAALDGKRKEFMDLLDYL